MPSKEARSKTPASPTNNRKRNLLFVGSAIAVVGLCITLKLMIGSKAANAQIPNPFRKAKPQEQSAQPRKTPARSRRPHKCRRCRSRSTM